jgi:aminoglycoside-2''-adenylyltransferase
MAENLGPWDPLDLGEITRLFEGWPARWWISGGVALELHLGRSWRSHDDSDVSILREDAPSMRQLLSGWDIQVAASGTLIPWDGSVPVVKAEQNNMWCRKAHDHPWCLDVTISDGDGERWIYRRNPTIQVLWADAVLLGEQGIPYLSPELQLLFKGKNNRTMDDKDASEVIPALSCEQRRWLRALLPGDHPWQAMLVG